LGSAHRPPSPPPGAPLVTSVTPPDAVAGRPPDPHLPVRVEKPWGYELIWAHTALYVGKLLFVRAGEALSLQFHEEKDETLHLLSGRMRFEAGPGLEALRPLELEEGMSVRIEPGMLHRIVATTDCTFLEASTPELDDVVRVQDRYGRAPTDPPDRR
jgi:mannose-6-phosphate isomerase